MTPDAHLAHLRTETKALLVALAAGDPDAVVPSCPAWRLRDLAAHVVATLGWIDAIVRAQATEPIDEPDVAFADDELIEAVADAEAGLVAAFELVPASAPIWAPGEGPHTVAWWIRRAALELAVHRVDAQFAVYREAAQIAADLAVDGVDEVLELVAAAGVPGDGSSLHLHATDTPGEWLITWGAEELVWTHAHEKGSVAVQADASGLLLVLWGRLRPADVTVFGDERVLERWQASVRI